MGCRTKTIVSCVIVLAQVSCASGRSAGPDTQEVQRRVEAFQHALIARGVTGGSVAGVFRGADTVAFAVVNSGIAGDTPISPETIFPIWSMSKPITIVAMMIWYERGLYTLDAPVSKYIPYFAEMKCKDSTGTKYRCKKELTIEHLLTHRSGYGYYERGKGPSHLDPYKDLDRFVRDVAAYPAEFEPGTNYLYGVNMAVLGRLVEVLSGQELYTFLKDNIFSPLEMPNTKFELSADDRRRWQVLFKKPTPIVYPGGFDEGTTAFSTADDELSYAPGTKAQFGGEGLVSTFEDYRHFCEMLLGKGS